MPLVYPLGSGSKTPQGQIGRQFRTDCHPVLWAVLTTNFAHEKTSFVLQVFIMTPSEKGRVIWFTGLSGAGKSTLCAALRVELERCGQRVKVLDGDDLRRGLCSDLGFTEKHRAENIRRIAHVGELVSGLGLTVLIATISPLQNFRDLARTLLPDMVEVFVDAPLAICELRDPKGLYRLARSGRLSGFTGIDSPFEVPRSPDLTCRTSDCSIEECIEQLMQFLGFELRRAHLDRQLTLAVDLDGVIANYDGWKERGVIGEPRSDVVAALGLLKREGWKIIIHTTRGANHVVGYLQAAEVPYDEINMNSDYQNEGAKPVASVYWDDRALTYSGDAMRDLPKIRAFKTWSGRQ